MMEYNVGARISILTSHYEAYLAIPFGTRGRITNIFPAARPEDVVYQIALDTPIDGRRYVYLSTGEFALEGEAGEEKEGNRHSNKVITPEGDIIIDGIYVA